MKTIGLSFASLMVLGLALTGATASQGAINTEAKNVSKWVASAQRIGAAEDSKKVNFTVFLSFKDEAGLKSLISALSTPGSAQYGKYLTPDQFRARFAPDADQVKLVQDTLAGLGFSIDSTPKSGLFVEASGTVAQVKAAFGVSQNMYAFKGKVLRANAETPKLPAKIAGIVKYVAGLDETAILRQPLHISARDEAVSALKAARSSAAAISPNAPPPVQSGIESAFCSKYYGDHTATLSTPASLYPQTLPWLVCGYTPQQVRLAYGADKVTQDGTGVRVGIVDVYASPTIQPDVNRYSNAHGLPLLTYLNFQQILPPGILNVPADDPCGPQGWYGEESLDFDAVHSMAPGAYIVYAAIACTDPANAALYNLIDNHLADIITNSYTYEPDILIPPDFLDSENQYFMQAAAEGISVMFSSGDDGDLVADYGIALGSWDDTSPYVTSIGGTSLALKNSSGAKNEWGWGDYRAFLNGATVSADGKSITTSGTTPASYSYYSGAGGGPSLTQLQPSYQAGLPYSLTGYTHLYDKSLYPLGAAYRITPDISMVADPYTGLLVGETYTVAGDPILDHPCKLIKDGIEYCEIAFGGTSLSSPLFAGVLALVNQARFAAGKTAVGFVNPALYSMTVAKPGTTAGPIIDVQRPSAPTAILRGYMGNPNRVRVVTMNSLPNSDDTFVAEGINTSFKTTGGYDLTTGLGTPYVPTLIQTFVGF